MSWQDLRDGNIALARFGEARFESQVAYLATVRKDGSPEVHPVTPILRENRLFVFMYPTSPKAKDLQRDGRYMLHCSVANQHGGEGEFYVRGKARLINDDAAWELVRPGHMDEYKTKYILFEFSVEEAFSMTYNDGETQQHRWKASAE